MKRKGLIALFMLFFALLLGRVGGGSTLYAQAKLYDVAVELMKNYPKDWEGSCYNSRNIEMRLCIPLTKVPSSLIDSIEVAFASEVAKADYTSVVRKDDGRKPYLSYALGWNVAYLNDGLIERSGHLMPGALYYGVFDTINDSLRVNMNIYRPKVQAAGSQGDGEKYDIHELEEWLSRLRHTYLTKKWKLDFELDRPNKGCKGFGYAIDCNADSVYQELYDYFIEHFCIHDSHHVTAEYNPWNQPTRMELTLREDFPQLKRYSVMMRKLQIFIYQDKLYVLDVGYDDPDGDVRTLIGLPYNWMERIKRKNIFSSTYVYPIRKFLLEEVGTGKLIEETHFDVGY